MAGNTSFRIRFRLNQQTGGRRQTKEFAREGSRFATAIVEQVGLEYSEELYKDLQFRVQSALRGDVRNEIEHIARQYARFIPGIGGQRFPRAELTTSTADRTGNYPGYSELWALKKAQVGGIYWTPRKARYLTAKRNAVGHTQWFKHKGDLKAGMANGSFWLNAFGPISVRVVRTKSTSQSRQSLDFGGKSLDVTNASILGPRSKGTFSVARVEVAAFGNITPSMLPALISGNLDSPVTKDGRQTGLMQLAGNADLEMAYRLAGDRKNVPYRPTLEPFLAFALTRSIPFAVFNRIASGLRQETQLRNYAVR